MDASGRAEWQALTAKLRAPLTFPPEWLEPVQYTTSTLHMVDEITTELQTVWFSTSHWRLLRETAFHAEYAALHGGLPMSDDTRTSLTDILSSGSRLLALASKIVHAPDYEMDIDYDGIFGTRVLPNKTIAHLAGIAALLGPNPDDALGYALLPLEQAKHHPASSFTSRKEANRLRLMGTESVATIALHTSDTALLRSTLKKAAELREQAVRSSSTLPASGLEAIAGIRYLRGKGSTIAGEVGESSYDYFLRHLRADLENASDADLRPLKRNQIDLLATAIHMFWPDQIIAKMKDIEDQYDDTLEPLALARYDLTMLLLAQRIAELEGRSVTSMSDLVPTYLPRPLNDPYTGAPYRFSVATRQFYSEGSDGDQSAKPFNYETHTGDITVPNFAQTTSTVAAILQGF